MSVTLPGHAALTITAQQLEDGGPAFEGRFGKGTGKWQLFLSARGTVYGFTRPIQVVSLLFSRGTGNLANLSGIGPGNDPNRGGDGIDYISGGAGDDVLNPGDHDSLYDTGPGDNGGFYDTGLYDTVYGSGGDDSIVYSDSGPTAYQWLEYSGLSTGINATINGITNSASVDKGALGTDTIVDVANPLNAGREAPYGGLGVGARLSTMSSFCRWMAGNGWRWKAARATTASISAQEVFGSDSTPRSRVSMSISPRGE